MPYGRTRQLCRSECNILPLVLKAKWYRMIESGEKREEYRDLTRFWHIRFLNFNTRQYCSGKVPVVEFQLGYGKNAERHARVINMVGPTQCSCFSVSSEAREGGEKWGEPDDWHFIIALDDDVVWIPEAREDGVCKEGRRSFVGCDYFRGSSCTRPVCGELTPEGKARCYFVQKFIEMETAKK